MTYNVFGGMLNLAQLNQFVCFVLFFMTLVSALLWCGGQMDIRTL